MPLAVIYSRASSGINAPQVTVEVDTANGLPFLSIVGLPETAVKESKDRVRSAILNSNFEFPAKKITINLAPADLPKKDGGRFDLPIAIGILVATGQLENKSLEDYEFAGELALSGKLRPIKGALPFALATKSAQRKLILPVNNADEAALINNISILPAKHLLDIYAHLTQQNPLIPHKLNVHSTFTATELDFADVKGQFHAKRALEIAAAGQHGILMVGPPGTGKSMLANRFPGILPLMNDNEAIETAAIYSICSKHFNLNSWKKRPFRAPHHTASSVALVGGGSPPKPGEISLAHNGVLFLDELPEFNRHVLEVLREPLESGEITISRAAFQAQFPAKFQLIAAMNPCPCGYLGDPKKNCHCTSKQIQNYCAKISGPLLDRVDIHITVPALPKGILTTLKITNNETSAEVCQRVIISRVKQMKRNGKTNAQMTNKEIEKFCTLNELDFG